MGSNSVLGLLFQISADPSKAQEAVAQFEKSTGTSVNQVVDHTEVMNKSLLNSHNSVHLLTEELGIHLPRAVVGAVAEMLPQIASLGTVLLGAFAIKELPEFISNVQEATSSLGGYSDELRKAAQADIDASTAALTHFKTIADGELLISQTNAALAEIARHQGSWNETAHAFSRVMDDNKSKLALLAGPLGIAVNLYRGYKGAVDEATHSDDEAAKLRARLIEQLGQMDGLQDKKHAADERGAKDAARSAAEIDKENHANAQKVTVYDDVAIAQRAWNLELARRAELQRQAAAADKAEFEMEAMLFPIERQQIQNLQILAPAIHEVQEQTVHLSVAKRELVMVSQMFHSQTKEEMKDGEQYLHLLQDLGDEMKKFAAATTQSTIATIMHGLAAHESFRKVAHEAMKSIAEEAGIRAIWELAQGVAMEAMFFFMPDPRYEASADAHFTAAAIYGGVAGGAAAAAAATRGGGGGGGSGSFGRGSAGGSYGSGRSNRDQVPPQTLAAGAASGRFSNAHVVVYSSDLELAHFVGAAVNRAVESGFHVTATSSQRGAPVGH